ncbi:BspA family leucine-rich repeat surface protein [Raoultibacter timonensis]|uniref:Pesticidal crystal protein Cry22Aa Ig-like domain-containing protein n=1 Tax=Raoultibacter timonensis TaxID=1907662 RepID=A0ABM7WF29_9ACTN|nr:BspA family leucine-rich repeat surface protein [Raoultibacter timonensis]BDE94830.1 hypothetical protein CE91St30_01630 [Raoultibacter timonensis]BDF49433.1 hypothetical protein CE91St31_01630 [Raoultibacter timonensis]
MNTTKRIICICLAALVATSGMQVAPAEAADAQQAAPTEAAPTEAAPTEAAPTEAAPTEAADLEGYGGFDLSDWSWTPLGDGVNLQRYKGESRKVAVPGKIEGYGKVYFTGGGLLFSLNNNKDSITHFKTVAVDGARPEFIGSLHDNFRFMRALEYVDMSQCEERDVQGNRLDMMFYECTNLKYVDVTGLVNQTYVSAEDVFGNCPNLETVIGLDTWDVSGIKSFSSMFNGCESLTDIDISNWDMSSATSTFCMFSECYSLESVSLPDFSNSINLQTSSGMFMDCTSLTSVDLSRFSPPNLEYAQSMFHRCRALERADLSFLNSGKLKVLSQIFEECTSLKEVVMPETNHWLTLASKMFYNCPSLDFVDLRSLDLSRVTEGAFTENFFLNPSEDGTENRLLVLSTDEKVINYNFDWDNRTGSGPTMDANGGTFASNLEGVRKDSSILVLPDLSNTALENAIANVVENFEVPHKEGYTFDGWEKVESITVSSSMAESAFSRLNGDKYKARWSTEAGGINRSPVISAEDKSLKVGDAFDPLDGVSAHDEEDGPIALSADNVVFNDVNASRPGDYSVTYRVTDSGGASSEKSIAVKVVDEPASQFVTPTGGKAPGGEPKAMPRTGDGPFGVGIFGLALFSLGGLLLALRRTKS